MPRVRSDSKKTCRTALALAVFATAPLLAQESGTVTGRVTEAGSGRPIPEVQLNLAGTTLGTMSNANGEYTIRAVPAGSYQLRALRVGFSEQKLPIVVTAGQATTQNVGLTAIPVSLAPVVTTATGEQRRVEIGNAVAQIDAAQLLETAPVTSIDDVINARAPGVIVTSGTQTGAGSRIRIRGQNSLSLSNDPIFIIDGVRMTSNVNSSSLFTGGAQPSRVGDLNPEEIENIEIVKGPSAATLYGTDAANGVVVITTKRGRAGRTVWNAYAEGGLIGDRNEYPTAYTIFGQRANGTSAPLNFCNLPRVSRGECTVDSVAALNVFDEDDLTPLGTGHRSQLGLQVSGGSELVRYFVAGEREDETGVLELPEFERDRFQSEGTPIREWTKRPNELGKNSVRANLNASPSSTFDIAVQSQFINLEQRFSLESNATAGLGSQIFGGPGCRICDPARTVSGTGTPLNGYRAWTPGYTWQEKAGQRVNRFIGSLDANWRPTTWLRTRATVGNDHTDRVDDNLLFRGEGPPITATYRDGFKENHRTDIRSFTTNLIGTASFNPRAWLNLSTTVGTNYVNYLFQRGSATGSDLPPGTQTAGAAAEPGSEEATTLQKTLGLFIEQSAALRDRLFLTAAVRSDQNSAFGTDFQRVFYPKASLSWIISDEAFFPQSGWLNLLRLRSAYGASGVQPGPNDALRYYSATVANVRGVDLPAVETNSLGNRDLKPERSTEFEAGFEAKLFGDRLGLDLTYYQKRTKDAIIEAIIPPSFGTQADEVTQNLGAVRNRGWEFLANASLVNRRNFALDVTLNASTNSNKLLSLGGTPPQIGTTVRAVEGFPVFGLWARPITGWEDKNGDGILTYDDDEALNEVFVGDEVEFRGYNQPRHFVSLTPVVELFDRRVRISTLFDYRGGHKWYNNTERIRCVSRQNCSGLMNPDASFEDQAMVVATRDHPSRTLDGFFQDGSFVKLREISLQYSFSPSFANRLRARSLSVVATARNVATWTDYRGVDPESDFVATTGSDAPSEFQTIAPPSFLILRLNLGF
jgi:TonB-linked SusC/RagA family outer membrane protein